MIRAYTVSWTAAVIAQQDLIAAVAGASKWLELVALYLSQSTEIGDAQEEGLSILIKSGQTTAGSGGTSSTPVPCDQITPVASQFTARINDTTKASGGTILTHHPINWNVRQPLLIWFPEEIRHKMAFSRRLTIELATTPIDSITVSAVAYFNEIEQP